MLYLNLKSIFEARQIDKPYSFLVKIGIAPSTAHKIINNNSHVLRLDTLTLICTALHCQPNDLLVYKPNPKNPIAPNHPLNKMIHEPADNQWQQHRHFGDRAFPRHRQTRQAERHSRGHCVGSQWSQCQHLSERPGTYQ